MSTRKNLYHSIVPPEEPTDPYNPYAPGLAHAGTSVPSDPYLGVPGQHFSPGDQYRGSTFAPGILNQGIDVGHGPG